MGDTLGLRDTQSPQSILEVKIINPNNFQFQRNSVVSHMDLVPIFGLVFVIFGNTRNDCPLEKEESELVISLVISEIIKGPALFEM
jgi:hypothetical protein